MPGKFDGLPDKVASINNAVTSLQTSLEGVNAQNLQQFFFMHRHSGSAMDGQTLYGPYLMRDSNNGKTYKLVCANGKLGVQQV